MSLFDDSPLYQLLKYENAGLSRFLLDAASNGLKKAISTNPNTKSQDQLSGCFFLCVYDPLSNTQCYLPHSLEAAPEECIKPISKIWNELVHTLNINPVGPDNHLLSSFSKLRPTGISPLPEITELSWHSLLTLNSLQRLPLVAPESYPTSLLRAQALIELIVLKYYLADNTTLNLFVKYLNPENDTQNGFAAEKNKFIKSVSKAFFFTKLPLVMPGTYLGQLTLVLPIEIKQKAESESFKKALDLRLQRFVGSLRLFQSMRAASFFKSDITQENVQAAMHCIFGRSLPTTTDQSVPFALTVDDTPFEIHTVTSLPIKLEATTAAWTEEDIVDYRKLCTWQLGIAAQANVRATQPLQQALLEWMEQQVSNKTLNNELLNDRIEVAYILAAIVLKLIEKYSLHATDVLTSIFVINFSKRTKTNVTEKIGNATILFEEINGWFQSLGNNILYQPQSRNLNLSTLKANLTSHLPDSLTVAHSRKLPQLDIAKSPTQLINNMQDGENRVLEDLGKSKFCKALEAAGFKLQITVSDLVVIYPAKGNLSQCTLQIA